MWASVFKRRAHKRAVLCALVLAWALALTVFADVAHGETRIALVIGNESYRTLDQLPYATLNARQVSQALNQVGFSNPTGGAVLPTLDLDSSAMVATLHAFEAALSMAEQGSVGVLYFAGHGVARARRGDVYLLPIDAALGERSLDEVGVPLADVLQLLRARPGRTVVIVVDACRNVASLDGVTVVTGARSAGGAGEGAGWGEDGAVGLLQRGRSSHAANQIAQGADYFVAFSTSPDRGAYDSDVFSRILSEEMVRGHDLLALFKRVGERMALEAPADRVQLPTYEVGVYSAPPCFGSCVARADPDRFFDCATCPWMRVVRPGGFVRGSPASEPGRDADEPQAVSTRIENAFAIGPYEVTRAEWRGCERAGVCRLLTRYNTWLSERAPITHITREDAEAFLRWLSHQSGARYRLPTEAEWEYAARAGAHSPFFFGSDIAPSRAAYDYSTSYNGSPRAEYRGAPEAAGAFPPNDFGMFDMHGNVWEWTQACAAAHQPDCAASVLRGGSFKSAPEELRAANRLAIRANARREDVGLRVVRDLQAEQE